MKLETAKRIIAEWLEAPIPSLVMRDNAGVNLENSLEILAIVGPRRSGKTFFMYQLIQGIMNSAGSKKDEILFVDFEDYRLADFKAEDTDTLFVAFHQLTGRNPLYIFFDEVQNLPGWSRVLRTLHNQQKYRIVVSGSNSDLLSREISSELRGRYRDILMLPFSFTEVLRMKKVPHTGTSLYTAEKGQILKTLDSFLEDGGYPEVIKKTSQREKRELIQTYFETIFYRDILERYNIKAKTLLETMMQYCLNIYGDLFSVSAFEKQLKTHGLSGSKRTIANYLHHMEEAFFVIIMEKFSFSPRKRIMNPKKVYLVDNGFAFLSTQSSGDRGKKLENTVAIELVRRKKQAFYHHGRKECDFVILSGRKPCTAIQVCLDLNDRNISRELDGLAECAQAYDIKDNLIITYDQEGSETRKGMNCKIMPAWKWLLEER